MIKYLKNNKTLFLVLFIMVGISFLALINNIREFNETKAGYDYTINKCNTVWKNDTNYFEKCEADKEWGGPKRKDAFFTFFDIIYDNKFSIMQLILPFLIIMYSIEKLNNKLKNGFIKNEMTRKKYSSIILDEWKSSIRDLWIIPFLFILVLFLSYCLTGNFDYKYSLLHFEPMLEPKFFDNIVYSIIIYITHFILQ